MYRSLKKKRKRVKKRCDTVHLQEIQKTCYFPLEQKAGG